MTEETIDHYENKVEVRPAFITVLCVLTWLVSVYTVLTVPFNYFISSEVTASSFQQDINEAMAEMAENSPEAAEMLEGFMMAASSTLSRAMDNAGWIAATDLMVALLSAFGAYLMFKLRKTGFWIYVGAKVLGLISVFAFLGVNLLTAAGVSFAGFIGLIFIILYGVNLKHMS